MAISGKNALTVQAELTFVTIEARGAFVRFTADTVLPAFPASWTIIVAATGGFSTCPRFGVTETITGTRVGVDTTPMEAHACGTVAVGLVGTIEIRKTGKRSRNTEEVHAGVVGRTVAILEALTGEEALALDTGLTLSTITIINTYGSHAEPVYACLSFSAAIQPGTVPIDLTETVDSDLTQLTIEVVVTIEYVNTPTVDTHLVFVAVVITYARRPAFVVDTNWGRCGTVAVTLTLRWPARKIDTAPVGLAILVITTQWATVTLDANEPVVTIRIRSAVRGGLDALTFFANLAMSAIGVRVAGCRPHDAHIIDALVVDRTVRVV